MSIGNKTIRWAIDNGYYVSDGDVYSPKRKEPLKKRINSYGYCCVTLGGCKNDRKPVLIHRLVAIQKYGYETVCQPNIQVRHLDSNKLNNNPDNIAIGTARDNHMDKPAEDRLKYSLNASSKLKKISNEQVQELKKDREAGLKYKDLSIKYGLGFSQISYIVNGKSRKRA